MFEAWFRFRGTIQCTEVIPRFIGASYILFSYQIAHMSNLCKKSTDNGLAAVVYIHIKPLSMYFRDDTDKDSDGDNDNNTDDYVGHLTRVGPLICPYKHDWLILSKWT